ncbi:NDR1/HIN1-like protein 26 [Rhodamnia argentea]|uniref:NDR1/HIN1-like protein 26 n=1 Tax=Rhodamnia argentea TaxID=178133 RepID=A0A8B8PC88_9MYRT|nr:NDR1/HIN1-like protein 26 [Rhodamnia argentea]
MSRVLISSPEHCERRGFNTDARYKKLLFAFFTALTLFLALVVLVWLILHPTKPQFTIKEADINQLNLSSPRLNYSIRLTLLTENPNGKVGIYYDNLQVYVAYRGQQITEESTLPPFYQGQQHSDLLTASLVGNGLPVAASLSYQVGRDQTAGQLVLSVKVNGQLRWKVGTWVSRQYTLNVNCTVVMAFQPSALVTPLSSKQGSRCSTSI